MKRSFPAGSQFLPASPACAHVDGAPAAPPAAAHVAHPVNGPRETPLLQPGAGARRPGLPGRGPPPGARRGPEPGGEERRRRPKRGSADHSDQSEREGHEQDKQLASGSARTAGDGADKVSQSGGEIDESGSEVGQSRAR